jgi:Ca2+-binding EF-hand superfamily protein
MKQTAHAVFVAVAVALMLPATGHAAKGGEKKKESPAEAFEAFDQNKDGVVTQAEYLGLMKKVLGEETAKTRFAALDKNSDGKLTKDEFGANGADTEAKPKRKKKNAS